MPAHFLKVSTFFKLRYKKLVALVRDSVSQLFLQSLKGVYAVYGGAAIVFQFCDIQFIEKYNGTWWEKIIASLLFFALFVLVGVLVLVVRKMFYTYHVCFKTSGGKSVGIFYGNILDIHQYDKHLTKANVIIHVNRCFDVQVDEKLISSETVHGQAVKLLQKEELEDAKTSIDEGDEPAESNGGRKTSFHQIMQHKLAQKAGKENLQRRDKPSGKLTRYPAGTYVEIPRKNGDSFFFLALSAFDRELHAHTSDEEYHQAMLGLLHCISEASQGFPVFVPLMGTGLSRARKNPKAVKEYLLAFLRLHESKLVSDVYIVIN